MIVLGCMDLDLVIRIEPLATLIDSSTTKKRAYYETWEHSNPMSIMIMKHAIQETIRSLISEEENAQKYLAQVADNFAKNKKVEASTILGNLVSMWYKGKGNI